MQPEVTRPLNPEPQPLFFTRSEAQVLIRDVIAHCREAGARVISEEEGDRYSLGLQHRLIEIYFADENMLKDGPPYTLTDLGTIQVEGFDEGSPACGFGRFVRIDNQDVPVTAEIIINDQEGAIPYLLGKQE